MNVSVVIPARLASTRLPRKVLADLGGRPVLRHVWERAARVRRATEVLVATDSEEVAEVVAAWGGQFVLTSPACRSGTERIASILDGLHGDFILNVQGDEPFIEPALLDALVERFAAAGGELVTPVYPIREYAALANPAVVKVARAADGRALYFSRSAIPHMRGVPPEQWAAQGSYWGHLGVYGYARAALARYPALPESALEAAESLEQLRFLEAGFCIQTVETNYHAVAIDTPADLERARALFAAMPVA
ncbi:MAG: 3-deoxy-manno-octulosonate cytidylyltransferase [Opitutales bacterium]|jgi:3-deoxy-manno-octulosonate cytidylyltransferase (CMP-KDO synthetase)